MPDVLDMLVVIAILLVLILFMLLYLESRVSKCIVELGSIERHITQIAMRYDRP